MRPDEIQEGFEVFAHDGDVAFGAVREVAPRGRRELVIYVENAGDFIVPFDAIRDVHMGKVILDRGKLDPLLQEAISHAHDAEDPNIADI
jgi:hypothetical protein